MPDALRGPVASPLLAFWLTLTRRRVCGTAVGKKRRGDRTRSESGPSQWPLRVGLRHWPQVRNRTLTPSSKADLQSRSYGRLEDIQNGGGRMQIGSPS